MLWHITLSNKTDIIFSILYYYAIKPKYHHHSNKNDNRQRKILFKGSCQESGLRFWWRETKKIIFGKRNNSSFLSYNNDTICFLRKLSDRWPPFSNHFRCRRSSIQKPSSGRTHVKSRVWEPLDYSCSIGSESYWEKNKTFIILPFRYADLTKIWIKNVGCSLQGYNFV